MLSGRTHLVVKGSLTYKTSYAPKLFLLSIMKSRDICGLVACILCVCCVCIVPHEMLEMENGCIHLFLIRVNFVAISFYSSIAFFFLGRFLSLHSSVSHRDSLILCIRLGVISLLISHPSHFT